MSELKKRVSQRWQAKFWTGILAILIGILVVLYPAIMTDLLIVTSGLFLIIMGGIIITEVLLLDTVRSQRLTFGLLGVIGILLGILAISVPFIYVIAIGIFIGGFLVVFGGMEFVMGLSVDVDPWIRALEVISGLVGIVAGILFILLPILSVEVGAFFLGIFLVIFGILRVIHAQRMKRLIAVKGTAA